MCLRQKFDKGSMGRQLRPRKSNASDNDTETKQVTKVTRNAKRESDKKETTEKKLRQSSPRKPRQSKEAAEPGNQSIRKFVTVTGKSTSKKDSDDVQKSSPRNRARDSGNQSIRKFVKVTDKNANTGVAKKLPARTRTTRLSTAKETALEKVFSFEESPEDTNGTSKPIKKKKVVKKKPVKAEELKNVTTVAEVQKKLNIVKKENQNDDQPESKTKEKKFFKNPVKDLSVVVDMNFFSNGKKKPMRRGKTKLTSAVVKIEKMPKLKTKNKKVAVEDKKENQKKDKNEKPLFTGNNTDIEEPNLENLEENGENNEKKTGATSFLESHVDIEEPNLENPEKNEESIEKKTGDNNEKDNENQPETIRPDKKSNVKVVSTEILNEKNKYNIRKTMAPKVNPFRPTNVFSKRFAEPISSPHSDKLLSPLKDMDNFSDIDSPPKHFSQYKNIVQSTPIVRHVKAVPERRALGENTSFNRMVTSPVKSPLKQSLQNKIQPASLKRLTENALSDDENIHKENIQPTHKITVEAVIEPPPSRILKTPMKTQDRNSRAKSVANITTNFDEIVSADSMTSPKGKNDKRPKYFSIFENNSTDFDNISSTDNYFPSPPKKVARSPKVVVNPKLEKNYKIIEKKKDAHVFNIDNAFGFYSIDENENEEKPARRPENKPVKRLAKKEEKVPQSTQDLRDSKHKSGHVYLNHLKENSSATVRHLIDEIENVIISNDSISSQSAEVSKESVQMSKEVSDESSKTNNRSLNSSDDSYSRKKEWLNIFDIEDEDFEGEKREKSPSGPVFDEMEFTHFKQPVRHSYSRKRMASYHTDDEEKDHYTESKKTTRKKKAKKEPKESKEVREWIKSVNKTFEEIDNYDLVVE